MKAPCGHFEENDGSRSTPDGASAGRAAVDADGGRPKAPDSYRSPHIGGNVPATAAPTKASVSPKTRPGAIWRALQRVCRPPHTTSQTSVANVVRPVTPPAGPYNVGAANIPASF